MKTRGDPQSGQSLTLPSRRRGPVVKHRCSIKAPPKKTVTNSVPKDRTKTGVITSSFPPGRASLKAQLVKNPPAMQETPARFLGREDLLEKGKATPSYPGQYFWASLVAQLVKNLPAMWETWIRSLGWDDTLAKGKASHPSILDPHSRPGEFHGLYSPWGRKESDTTGRLSLHFSTLASHPPEILTKETTRSRPNSPPSQPLLSPVPRLPNPRSPTPAAKEKPPRSRRPLSTQVSLYLDHGSAVYTGAPGGKKRYSTDGAQTAATTAQPLPESGFLARI